MGKKIAKFEEIDLASGREFPMQVTADQNISHPLPLINAPMHLEILWKMD